MKNLDYVKAVVIQADPDILVLSESWLRKSITDCDVSLAGYSLFRADRARRGGGVAIYVKAGLNVSILDSISISSCFEFISLQVHLGSSSLVVIGVYRPPSASVNSLDTLAELSSKYVHLEMIVVGDFNVNWLSGTSEYMRDVFLNFNLTQLITEPTRPNMKDQP